MGPSAMVDEASSGSRSPDLWRGSASNPYLDIPGDALEDDAPMADGPFDRAPSDPTRKASSAGVPAIGRRPEPVPVRGQEAVGSTEYRPAGYPRHGRPEQSALYRPSEREGSVGVPASRAGSQPMGAPRHQTVIAQPLPPKPTLRGSSSAGTDRLARAEAARRALDADAYFLDESHQPRKGRSDRQVPVARPGIERHRLHFWRWFRTLPIIAMTLFATASIVVSTGLFGIDRWLYPVEYNETIAQMAEAYGVDPLLVSAVIRTESGWDPEAVSRMGAVGLMQLLPGTAADLAASGEVDASRYDPTNLLDPETNIAYGTAYLRDCLANTADLDQAIAAYNAGIAAAQGWAQSGTPFEEAIQYPETTAYLERVRQNLDRYQQTYQDGFPTEEAIR